MLNTHSLDTYSLKCRGNSEEGQGFVRMLLTHTLSHHIIHARSELFYCTLLLLPTMITT